MRTVVGSMSALRSAAFFNGNGDLARHSAFNPALTSHLSSQNHKNKTRTRHHRKPRVPTNGINRLNDLPKRHEEDTNNVLSDQLASAFLSKSQQCQWSFFSVPPLSQFAPKDVQQPILESGALKDLGNQQNLSDLFREQQVPVECLEAVHVLLELEPKYHPNTQVLYNVNHDVDEKVDFVLRNEAVTNLRFLHKGFFHLSQKTFTGAVNLLDRFAVKVKVKPKYLACVVTACYALSADIFESEENKPTVEDLILVSKCGGTSEDFIRMMDIIKTKLSNDLCGVTWLDFVNVFYNGTIPPLKLELMNIAFCSLEPYRFRASCLALTLLTMTDQPLLSSERCKVLSALCQVNETDLIECRNFIQAHSDSFYEGLPRFNRDSLVWTLSKRTLKNICSSSPPMLDTITETE